MFISCQELMNRTNQRFKTPDEGITGCTVYVTQKQKEGQQTHKQRRFFTHFLFHVRLSPPLLLLISSLSPPPPALPLSSSDGEPLTSLVVIT